MSVHFWGPEDGNENQLWFEEWLKLRIKFTKKKLSKLDKIKNGLLNLNLSHLKLKGKFIIEDFPELVSLNLGNNQLTEVEIKNCPILEDVIVSHNKLTKLKIENCPEITDLYAAFNKLTNLDFDINELENLEVFSYSDNEFLQGAIDEFEDLGLGSERVEDKQNPVIDSSFFIGNNQITQVDVSSEANFEDGVLAVLDCPNLTHLTVDNCKLEELIIENCPKLKHLSFRHNKVRKIDLSNIKLNSDGFPIQNNLRELYCSNNLISKINLNWSKKLKHLVCDNNPIERLEVKQLKSLKSLYCFKCRLKKLDCSGLSKLKELYCANNVTKREQYALETQLILLSLSGCDNLKELDCAENGLIELDISNLEKLEFVSCKENRIRNLNASNCANLKFLDYSKNFKGYGGLNFLNVFNCLNLRKVFSTDKVDLNWTEFPNLELLMVDNEDVPEFEEYLLEKSLRQKSFKNKIKRAFKKYYSNFEKLKDLLNSAKTPQKLEETWTSIKNHPLYQHLHKNYVEKTNWRKYAKGDDNKSLYKQIRNLYIQKKLHLALEENTRRAQQNAEQEQKWQQEQEKKQREQTNIEKSLLDQSISSIKTYWTNKKILDKTLEEVLGPYWKERFNNKKFEQYPASVEYLKGLINAWISINQPQKQEEDKSNPPKIEITEELINKFSSIPNFDKEKVEELLNSVKDNEEFLQQHPDLTSKSPKEAIIAIKRFEYDKDNKIRQYYNLKEDVTLTEEQINEYLYLEAVGQLQEKREQTAPPSQSHNKSWLIPVLIVVSVLVVGVVGVINYELKTKSKKKRVK